MRTSFVWMLVLVLAFTPAAMASAEDTSAVQILDVRRTDENITLRVRVTDPARQLDLPGLDAPAFTIVENGVPITATVSITPTFTSVHEPALMLPHATGTLTLTTVGTTIGIVFDASTFLNGRRDPTNYIESGSQAIEAFLDAGAAREEQIVQMAGNPPPARAFEAISIFAPLSSPTKPGEVMQPLAEFVQNRRIDVKNAVRDLLGAPRRGKTNVIDTTATAVEATAQKANERHSSAVVLLVSDGDDQVSTQTTYAQLGEQATALGVKIIVLAVGRPAKLDQTEGTLQALAAATGGAYLRASQLSQIPAFYQQAMPITPQGVYDLSYTTTLGEGEHQIAVRVGVPVNGQSEPIALAAAPVVSQPIDLPTTNALIVWYARLAIPFAVGLALFMALVSRLATGGFSSITDLRTRRNER